MTEDTVIRENVYGAKKEYVRTDIGTTVLETPKRVRNPINGKSYNLKKLSKDGYCRRFLALLSASNSVDVVDFGSTPVATFDKERWQLQEENGQYVLVKQNAESKFGQLLLESDEKNDE